MLSCFVVILVEKACSVARKQVLSFKVVFSGINNRIII